MELAQESKSQQGRKKNQMNKNNIGLKLNEIFELISFLWESKKKALTACNTTEACEINIHYCYFCFHDKNKINLHSYL